MNSWKCSIIALTLLLGGCQKDDSTALLLQKPVSTRPIVALVPVMDHSKHNLSWNVSHELTQSIRQKLSLHNQLYLLSQDQVDALSKKPSAAHDPFDIETAWIKKAYSQNEFVAFFELLEHRELPLSLTEEDSPAELNIVMRVRVFDLRGALPKIVLQEVTEQSHHIPLPFTKGEEAQVAFGDEMFEISPLGLAHQKLSQEISSRVEDYILLSCSPSSKGSP